MKNFAVQHRSNFGGMLLIVLLVAAFTSIQMASVTYAAGTITGTVFRDFNADGIDNGTSEIGVGGITVTAYDTTNTVQGTATSAANGAYSLSATGTGPYRIEFTDLPTGYYTGPLGSGSGSTVRFVPDGNASNINLGVNHPEDYSQANPRVVVPFMFSGSNVGSAEKGLVSQLYNSATSSTAERVDATLGQIGATWGIGFQRSTRHLFVGATLKRHSGFGPQGPGGVYIIDYSVPATASFAGSFSLQGVTPANGGAAIDLGTANRINISGAIAAGAAGDFQLPANSTSSAFASRDLDAFAKIGKTSYGDVDVDETANKLWLVNLNQQALIEADLNGATVPGTVNQHPIIGQPGIPGCVNGEFRPWGLKFYRGVGYLGGVCDASGSQSASDLRAYVLSFNPTNVGAGFTQVVTFALTQTREAAESNNLSPGTTPNRFDGRWKPWADTWAQTGLPTTSARYSYPQPILSDIEFDIDGSMILGFANRFAAQSGLGSYLPLSGNTTTYTINNAGDIVRACNVAGTFVLESLPGCPVSDSGPRTGDGFNNTGEYYWSEHYWNSSGVTYHLEIANGALALQPGRNEVISTAYDPANVGPAEGVFGQGLIFLNNSTGGRSDGWQIDQADPFSVDPLRYGKGNGLGDVELIIDPAPIEVGNRIWRDTNGNGIQEANETGVSGVVIGLYDAAGVLIDTVTTDSTGIYAFSSAAGTDATGRNYGMNIQPNTDYTVAVLNSNLGTSSALAGLVATTANSAGVTSNKDADGTTPDTTDSDGVTVAVGTAANAAAVGQSFTTGPAGANNHSFDFGFTNPVSIGNQVWTDTNQNGVRDPGEPAHPGIEITLYDSNGAPIATAISDNNGYYEFTNLVPGTYTVGVTNLPPDVTITGVDQGSDDGVDSDVNPTTRQTSGIVIVPGQDITTVWIGIIPFSPTAITLSHFSAAHTDAGLVVRWTTSTELRCFSFQLYRGTSSQFSEAARVTDQAILAQGGAGASYSWTDPTAAAGAPYWYWLEETELDGTIHLYGPVKVNGTAPTATPMYTVMLPLVVNP